MLYLILLSYVRPLAEIDEHLEGHRAFLNKHYDAGHFLMSGPKQPRSGGVILASAGSEEEVSQWLAEDPFIQSGVASCEIVCWQPTKAAAGWPLEKE